MWLIIRFKIISVGRYSFLKLEDLGKLFLQTSVVKNVSKPVRSFSATALSFVQVLIKSER